jgi:CO/xanthine dehydrogenase FAD-binding subunit
VAATAALQPPGDYRGSTEYRLAMLGVLLRRALLACTRED